MKKNGFSIVELMIAVAMATAIIAVMTSSFSSLNNDFMYSWNQLSLRRDLRVPLNMMLKDLRNSGTFGNFSFHNEAAASSYDSANTGNTCNSDWCVFDNTNSGMGVGVRTYTSANAPANVIPAGFALDGSSDVLRVQSGANSTALNFSTQCTPESGPFMLSGNMFSCLKFATNNLTPSRTYMLTSSNQAYLVNFGSTYTLNSDANNTSLANSISVTKNINESVTFYTPDIYTMTISNLQTSYYFVGTPNGGVKGLYLRKLKDDGSGLTDAKLLSSAVSRMQVSVLLLYVGLLANERINNYNTVNNNGMVRYLWCSAAGMQNVTACSTRWARVAAINVALSGQSQKQVSGAYLTATESAGMGWLW